MTEQIDATNTTEHMADAESTAESAKAAVRGVEETHPEYVDFAVDDFPGGLPACLEAILMVADQRHYPTSTAENHRHQLFLRQRQPGFIYPVRRQHAEEVAEEDPQNTDVEQVGPNHHPALIEHLAG